MLSLLRSVLNKAAGMRQVSSPADRVLLEMSSTMYVKSDAAHSTTGSTCHTRLLDVIPSASSVQRLVIEQQAETDGSQLVLVQESFAADVGWFPQSRVVVQADQLAALKALLSGRAVSRILSQSTRVDACDAEPVVYAFPQAS